MRAPPERYHVFISYTTREEEVHEVKPLVDLFLDRLRPAIERYIKEPPAFYDGYFLYELRNRRIPDRDLEKILIYAVEESEILLAFVSPEYIASPWCEREYTVMATKRPRPWFDNMRHHPIDQLERRHARHRVSAWDSIRAACRRKRWDWSAVAPLGGPIIPIVWKGAPGVVHRIPAFAGRHVFDWTSWVVAQEVSSHLARHGSVSPAWQQEAQKLTDAMDQTADTILKILEERRKAYQLTH
jgi:hypothetical protein